MGTFISEKRHWAQVLVPATVYLILATVYWHLWNWVPTINWIGQKGCLQFIGSLGHYFTPEWGVWGQMSKRAKQWKFDMQYEAPQIQMIFLLEYMQIMLGSTSNLLSVLFLPSSSFLSFSTLYPIESSPPPSTSSSSSSPLSGAPPWRAHLRGFPLRMRLPRQRRPGK